jgi:superfamily II DNA or RNA helicase
MILRPYQTDFVNGALALWRNGDRRIAGVMATGGGKTPTGMAIAKLSIEAGLPALWLAHRTELIDQAIDKAQQVAPDVRIGRLQGSTKEHLAQLVVGSIQTASTPTSLTLLKMRRWGLIVVDETHHVAAATYQRVLRELGAYGADGPLVLGLTATLDRSDGLSLGDTFQSVVDPKVGLIDLVRAGWLVPPRGIRVRIAELDLSRVRSVGGDLNAGQLGAAMTASMAPQRIVEAWTEHAKGRPTIAFMPTVAVSIEQAEAFNAAGYRAVHLDGTSPAAHRAQVLADFAEGAYDCVCNVGLFTEGTDLPFVSCVILKMTSSGTLYQQMVGRGLRIHPDKRDCVILDPTGVTGRHKLATLASLNGAPVAGDIPDDLLMYEEDAEAAEEDVGPGDGPEAPEYVDGDLAHEMIDLFGQSHSAWLRTCGGTWFLPAGPGFVFLAPAGADRYDLSWATDTDGGFIQHGMEIGYAMAAGDEYVAARPIWQTDRSAPWRSMRVRGGRTKGELADEKAVQRASTVLDTPSR